MAFPGKVTAVSMGGIMKWVRKHRPSPGTAFGAAALMIALGGVAFAAIPDSNGTIHACYQKNSGGLRVVETSNECRQSELPLSWAQGASPTGGGIQSNVGQTQFGASANVLTLSGLASVSLRCEDRPDNGGNANFAAFLTVTNEGQQTLFVHYGFFIGGPPKLSPGEAATTPELFIRDTFAPLITLNAPGSRISNVQLAVTGTATGCAYQAVAVSS